MTMKHFVFVMWEGGGTVTPEIALARQLRTRGHRITVLGDDSLRQEAQAAGVTFVGYERAPNRPTKSKQHDPLRDWELDDPRDVLQAAVTRIMCGPALSVAQDLLALCERDAADVVVGCGFVLGAIIWADKAGVPAVGLVRMSLCPPAVLQLVRPHVSIARSNDQ